MTGFLVLLLIVALLAWAVTASVWAAEWQERYHRLRIAADLQEPDPWQALRAADERVRDMSRRAGS